MTVLRKPSRARARLFGAVFALIVPGCIAGSVQDLAPGIDLPTTGTGSGGGLSLGTGGTAATGGALDGPGGLGSFLDATENGGDGGEGGANTVEEAGGANSVEEAGGANSVGGAGGAL